MTTYQQETASGPLAGLVVVDASSTLPGAQVSQFLADCGAEVIMVEPPGGSMVRQLPGWPALLRGKRSVTLDLRDAADQETLRGLLQGADVFVHTLRPGTAERIGLTAEALAEKYPRLVTAHITGWGSDSPWRDYKGWEGLVYAKTGAMWSKRQLTLRPGPAFVTAPYASWGASQAAIHGVLAALLERDVSGRGQVVESDLVRGLGALEVYNWFYELVLHRFPGAFTPMDVAYDDDGIPQAYLIFALLIASTKDGTWLQFAQTAPRLMQAWLIELGLAQDLADPKWAGFPMLPTAELRGEWWTTMLERVRERTFEEWQETFERNPDVSAEIFNTPDGSFDHPQTVFDGRVQVVDHPELGPVRQSSTLIHAKGAPLVPLRPAPSAGADDAALAALLDAAAARRATGAPSDAPATLPLEGITILEFGSMFAGPYGTTVLTDMGARVIHVETLEGDNIRSLVAFPEAGGAKVMQGKESLTVDLATAEGLSIVHELVPRVDLVVQCFRGDTAIRMGLGEEQLKKLNPGLVYLNAPGYGTTGPYAGRPAYAPSIDATAGLSATDGGGVRASSDMAEIKLRAASLHAAGAVNCAQADGIAALAVGSGLLLGLYAKRRGIELPDLTTTMLASAQQSVIVLNTQYEGRPELEQVDGDFLGLHALYRLYPAADGWVFLATPYDHEWAALTKLAPFAALGGDARFTTRELRRAHDAELAETLAGIFAGRAKADWEDELTAQDVGCVAVTEENLEWAMQDDAFFDAGYCVEAVNPIFDEHRRLAPITRFSRSRTKADAGCTLGQHTTAILRELGYADDRITDLQERSVVGGA
ncbi:crotonobetainyl-CoA:carnitine CoA-transferase CaiB-like acyl-CoA transferase [Actinocorallia herbida]|uniref:Crotonobetainyl-CoA:carnitine CoA-transferase CaiB-like acyl-CoA transferase n=1 Tax=Actinocorallia herbida TaxID=58109 RepID=A0A3N1D2Z3_9ACTN|nr:CoA transferase [Actinocorallia herbida]ROO87907.1 crotonobetainyl-CoA:carnitine CoA-transferase CaiB-like acyl-CoA transferase [Actinocorallia herbida]